MPIACKLCRPCRTLLMRMLLFVRVNIGLKMKRIKKIIMRTVLGIEFFTFAWLYVYGPHGLQMLGRMKHENHILEQHVQTLQDDVRDFENKIVAWNAYPFYKEQVAREQLQMARKDEIIYYI